VNAQPDVQPKLLPAVTESADDFAVPQPREVHTAAILAIEQDGVRVNLGARRDGLVPSSDLERLSEEERSGLQVGDSVPVYVVDNSDDQNEIVVSLVKGLVHRDWLRAHALVESQESCEGTVTAVNRGGVVVPFGRLRGFVPNSHLVSIPQGLRNRRLHQAKSALIGKTLTLAVIEADPRRQKLTLSERAADTRKRDRLFSELSEGDVRLGTVRSLVSFGAFVDLGGAEGLIHVSELDWQHVGHPREVLEVGDQVEVYVLRVEHDKGRIGLSRKRLLPDPWSSITEGLSHGDVVEGRVTQIVDFGAFVDLGDGVEGLVHVSEMSGGEEAKASLEPGTIVYVQILRIDSRRRRISLSLRTFGD
jgi:small subunit ribosomal protein S1